MYRRHVSVCLCVSVCLSQSDIKMAKRMPHDSPGMPKITAKFELNHPLTGATNASGVG